VLALNYAAGLLEDGKYDHVIVSGVDIVSRFVVSGFMSFLSLSPDPCKPFDKDREGLSLGEGAGTIILSREKSNKESIVFKGGSTANDANHISGPSRNGEGSFIAIQRALKEAGVSANQIDHISAHGTATVYNDEMESISISRHALEQVPVNSFKGYWGHTLGAAGIIETAALLHEMRSNTLIRSAGYSNHGVSRPITVIDETHEKELNVCLKMASGFGGSNAAMILQKV
jgi:3-oxoacyl-[acyl-carrier-protein] synthase-1